VQNEDERVELLICGWGVEFIEPSKTPNINSSKKQGGPWVLRFMVERETAQRAD